MKVAMRKLQPADSGDDRALRDSLRDRIMGFRVTQMIYVAAKLGLADQLAARPMTPEALAAAVGADPQALHRLLRALAGIGLFAEDAGGAYGLTAEGALLRSDVPGSLHSIAILYGEEWLWQAYGAMLHSVRTGQSAFIRTHGQTLYGYLQEHPRAAAQLNAAMSGVSGQEIDAILGAYEFSTVRSVVDIGGGQGALIAGLLQAHPQLHGIAFDLPSVVAGASQLFERAGLADRARGIGGDFFEHVARGGDLYLLKPVLHNWDDEDAERILGVCRAAMDQHARLLVIERVIPPGNEPSEAKLFDISMMTVAGGRERTAQEYHALLAKAGLALTRVIPTASPLSLIEARPK
jgi:hypothetical protein